MATPISEAAIRAAGERVIKALAPSLEPPRREALGRYLAALGRFSAHTDLVGARTAEALAEIALADPLVLARQAMLLRAPVWEIGAGGASLSIPLAILVDTFSGRVIEPRQKRATFLRMAIGTLGLASRLTVDQSRVEPDRVPLRAAGCALGRAVFGPETWLPMASRLVAVGGAFAVLTTDELKLPEPYVSIAVERYALPFSNAARTATWVAAVDQA